MKNILIYKLNKQTEPVVKFLSGNQEISFYIALTREDFIRLIGRIKPEIIFLSDENNLAEDELRKIFKFSPRSVIYKIYSNENSINPMLIDLRSNIKVKFMELIN